MKAAPIITALNAGELSPALEGRVDLSKYSAGCKLLENFVPLIQGPASPTSAGLITLLRYRKSCPLVLS